MQNQLILGALRNLENRELNLPDNSPMALDAHVQRGASLHEAFDVDAGVVVLDWGDTDDKESHEHVTIEVAIVGHAVFQYAVLPGIKWLGEKLVEKAVDAALTEGIKHVLGKLWPKMKARRIEMLTINIPVRDAPMVIVNSADGGSISVNSASGSVSIFRNIETGAPMGEAAETEVSMPMPGPASEA